ncbi:hypothetical protein [Streptomyces chryseus]
MKVRNALKRITVLGGIMAMPLTFLGQTAEAADPEKEVKVGESAWQPTERVPEGFRSWGELWSVQHRLNTAAEKIEKVSKLDKGSGYAGIIAAPENRELKVYWHGAVPDQVESAIAIQQVPIQVIPAKYSASKLHSEALRLNARDAIKAIIPKVDGSGLALRVNKERSLVADKALKNAVRAARVEVEITEVPTSLSAHTVAGRGPSTLPTACGALSFCRQNDTPPYYAGGQIWNTFRQRYCSTGFAVQTGDGKRGMLTNSDCGWPRDLVSDGGGDSIGFIRQHEEKRGTAIIEANAAGRIFDGGYDPATTFSKPVAGATQSYVGNWLCTSGAFSGVICGIKVTEVNGYMCCYDTGYGGQLPGQTPGGLIRPVTFAMQVDGTSAGGTGDDGGPIFELTDDTQAVIAKGIFDGASVGSSERPCTGDTWNGTRRCSREIYYSDVKQTLSHFGATIIRSAAN